MPRAVFVLVLRAQSCIYTFLRPISRSPTGFISTAIVVVFVFVVVVHVPVFVPPRAPKASTRFSKAHLRPRPLLICAVPVFLKK